MRILVLITSVVLIVACSGSDEQSRAPDPRDIIVSKPFLNSLSSTSAVDIVISYGQSNAVGRGFYDADNILVITPTANVKAQICPVDGEITYNSSCYVFNSLASPSDIYLRGRYSSWTSFDQQVDALDRRKLVLINAAVGAQPIRSLLPDGEIIATQNGINEYDNLVAAVLEAIRVFGASNINSVSVIWLHGERTGNELSQSNSDNAAIFERFQEYFSDLVYLREQLLVDLGIPKLWFFINRVGIVETPFSQRFASILNDLGYWQIELARVNDLFLPLSILPRTFSVTQGTLSDDALHYSSIGYNNLGAENATNWDLFMEGNDISNLIYGDNDLYLPSIVVEQPF